jgi:phytoene/squalene synthetase
LEFEFERTEGYYRHARAGIPRLQTGRWGVMSGLEVYRAILDGIRRNGYDVFNRRAGATRLQKVRLALRARWAGMAVNETTVQVPDGVGASASSPH